MIFTLRGKRVFTPLIVSIIFIISFIISYLPYVLRDLHYPIGWDTVGYVFFLKNAEEAGLVATFAKSPITIGYTFLAFQVHLLFGLDFYTVEKILPVIISSLIPVLFYLIILKYTGNQPVSVFCGFLSAIWWARLRLGRGLHHQLLAVVISSIIILLILSTKVKKRSFVDHFKTKSTYAISFLMLYGFVTHAYTLGLYLALILTAVVLFLRLRLSHQNSEEIKAFVSWTALLVIIPIIFFLLFFFLLPPVTGQSVLNVLTRRFLYFGSAPVLPLSYIYETVFSSSSQSYLPLYIWLGEGWSSVPAIVLFASTLMSFFMLAGVLVTLKNFLSCSSDTRKMINSLLLFLWFTLIFTSMFGGTIGSRIDPVRALWSLPAPIFSSIGLWKFVERMPPHKTTLTRAFHNPIFMTTLLLLPVALSSVNYSSQAPVYFRDDVREQIEFVNTWREANHRQNPSIFIVGFKRWNIELYMVRIWFSDRPVLVYYGKIHDFLQDRYSPHPNPDKNELSFETWELFRQDMEKYRISKADCDVYVLSSLYELEDGEKPLVEMIGGGIYQLRK